MIFEILSYEETDKFFHIIVSVKDTSKLRNSYNEIKLFIVKSEGVLRYAKNGEQVVKHSEEIYRALKEYNNPKQISLEQAIADKASYDYEINVRRPKQLKRDIANLTNHLLEH